jgi:hypothetical protein
VLFLRRGRAPPVEVRPLVRKEQRPRFDGLALGLAVELDVEEPVGNVESAYEPLWKKDPFLTRLLVEVMSGLSTRQRVDSAWGGSMTEKRPEKVPETGWSLWTAGPSSRSDKLPKGKIPGLEAKIAKLDIPECPEEELRAFQTSVSAETLARSIGG